MLGSLLYKRSVLLIAIHLSLIWYLCNFSIKTTKKEPAKESTSNKETNAQKEGGLKDGDSFTLGVTYTSSDNNKKKELTIEEKLLIDEFAEEGGYYRYNDIMIQYIMQYFLEMKLSK